MNYKTMKRTVLALLGTTFVLCILALALTQDGSDARRYCTAAALVLLALLALTVFLYSKCPHCGTRIIQNLLSAKVCPCCGRPLYEGAVKVEETPAKKKVVHKKKKKH